MKRAALAALLAAATVGTARADDNRLGRFTLDARIGSGVSVFASSSTFASAGYPLLDTSLEISIAVSPGRRMRLVFAPDFVYTTQGFTDPTQPTMSGNRDVFIVSIPVGVEYDLPIARVPGLYIYPQLLIGYAANTEALTGDVAFAGGDTTATLHQGVVDAALGLRYAFKNRFEIVFEPFDVPVYFSRGSALVLYRARVGVGVRF